MRAVARRAAASTQVTARILKFNAGREPERLAMKYRNMRGDAFVFLRATCHLYYERLQALLPKAAVLRDAPAAWACGDLHLENFGSYQGDNRQVYFDIDDFDEAVLAPASWDAVRFLSSVMVGRHALGVSEIEARDLCAQFVEAYADTLHAGKARWVERDIAGGPVHKLLDSLRGRSRAEFLDRRTTLKNKRRRLRIDGDKALVANREQRARVKALVSAFAETQPEPRFFKPLDVARRIAGNGSLGQERYVVLVRGEGHPDGNLLLDLKATPASSLAAHTPLKQPRWPDDAQRVLAIQQRMQAVCAAFLHPLKSGPQAYVLRELHPSEDGITFDGSGLKAKQATELMTVMAECLASAQLRSSGRQGSACADALIDFGRRHRWRQPLIAAACQAAEQVQADWLSYCTDYDAGAVEPLV